MVFSLKGVGGAALTRTLHCTMVSLQIKFASLYRQKSKVIKWQSGYHGLKLALVNAQITFPVLQIDKPESNSKSRTMLS